MAYYKMNFSGSLKVGSKREGNRKFGGRRYRFNEGDLIELPDGVKLDESYGEKVSAPREEKKSVVVAGQEVETAEKAVKAEKRKQKNK